MSGTESKDEMFGSKSNLNQKNFEGFEEKDSKYLARKQTKEISDGNINNRNSQIQRRNALNGIRAVPRMPVVRM